MPETKAERELRHQLANAEQQKRALQQLLQSASDEIEELVSGECTDEDKAGAIKAARKFRRAATL
jgi:Spy/CpxP family protein refolding chaperone